MKLNRHYTSMALLLMLMTCCYQLFARFGNEKKYFQLAEKEYTARQYMYAIPLYKVAIKQGNKDGVTLLRLADCYWQIRNIDSALSYFKQYEEKSGGVMDPKAYFRFAELLAQNKEYKYAVSILEKAGENSTAINSKLVQARKEGFQNTEKLKEDSLRYHIRFLNINSLQSDYSPQYYGQGIVYISNRVTNDRATRQIGWNGKTYSRLYQVKDASLLTAKDTAGNWHQPPYMEEMKFNDDNTRPTSNDNGILPKGPGRMSREDILALYPAEPFANSLYIDFNNGPVCFNKEGNVIYFTRNRENKKKGIYNLEICTAVLKNGEWGQVKALSFAGEGYDYFHPALSADGSRLYFCSNQPGGAGGTDIYSVVIDAGDFAPMIINETSLNTEGNELFPTFHGDTLYFSSDGYGGLGGLDIYKSWRENSITKAPVNVGYPVNSSYDDFGMVYAANDTQGLFTSNRLGSDDVYTFNINTGYITRAERESLERTAKIKREKEEAETKRVADSIARKQQEELAIKQQEEERKKQEALIRISQNKKLTTKEVEAKLKNQQLDEADRKVQADMDKLAKQVLFETAKDILLPESVRILEEVKAFMDKHSGYMLMIEGHTDNRAGAAYNLDLSKKRAAAVRKYLISKGIHENRMYSAGYGLTRPVATNETPEGRQLNRRVEMKIVKAE